MSRSSLEKKGQHMGTHEETMSALCSGLLDGSSVECTGKCLKLEHCTGHTYENGLDRAVGMRAAGAVRECFWKR